MDTHTEAVITIIATSDLNPHLATLDRDLAIELYFAELTVLLEDHGF